MLKLSGESYAGRVVRERSFLKGPMMKKYWASLGLAIAILCVALNSELWTSQYKWQISGMPTILTWAAVLLGIPSGSLLLFCTCRYFISRLTPSADKARFLTVLWLGIVVIVIMCLCPPWVETVRLTSSNIKGTNPIDYAFLWHPPDINTRSSGVAIDYSRLLLQVIAVGLATGGLIYTLKDKKRE